MSQSYGNLQQYGVGGGSYLNHSFIPLTQEMHPIPNAINKQLFDINAIHVGQKYYVDSAFRDLSRFAEPNKYSYFMEDQMKNIYAVTLIQHYVPRGKYNITANYNKIFFQETTAQVATNTYYTATVPVGTYDASGLATAIKTAMETVGAATYTVAVDPLTLKFSIASAMDGGVDGFALIFTMQTQNFLYDTSKPVYLAGSMGPVLGYSPVNLVYMGPLATTWIAQNTYDLNPQQLCILKLKFSATDCEPIRSTNPAFDRAFCVFNVGSGISAEYSNSDVLRTTINPYYIFHTPLEKFNRIDIAFYDKYNNLYDFTGQNHILGFYLHTNPNDAKCDKY